MYRLPESMLLTVLHRKLNFSPPLSGATAVPLLQVVTGADIEAASVTREASQHCHVGISITVRPDGGRSCT